MVYTTRSKLFIWNNLHRYTFYFWGENLIYFVYERIKKSHVKLGLYAWPQMWFHFYFFHINMTLNCKPFFFELHDWGSKSFDQSIISSESNRNTVCIKKQIKKQSCTWKKMFRMMLFHNLLLGHPSIED